MALLSRLTSLLAYRWISCMKVIGDSKVTGKFQATIPRPVRELLRLNSGDRIVFLTEGSHVRVMKGKLEVQL